MATKLLTINNDTWTDTAGIADFIDALAGDDTLDGGLGNDNILGGAGNDLIAGGDGIDTLHGNDGDDLLDGGVGADKLYGDAGNDILLGGTGFDTLNGGTGNDYLFGGIENDVLYGGAGSDLLEGGDGADILADTDNITTYGTNAAENDDMIGGLGVDTFYGGYDTMWGNDGNDIFNVKNKGTVYGGTGDDKITVTNTTAGLNSWLEGGLGSDTIIAGAGNDTLFSGYGADKLTGGAGNDNYVMTFDNMADTITELAGGGTDTVYYIRDFKNDGRDDDVGTDGKELDPATPPAYNFNVSLAANIENGVLDDQVYIFNPNSVTYTIAWLTGNGQANRLQGSSLDDILDGGAGNDTIIAGDGDDIIFAGNGTDTINGGAGYDLIASSVSFNLATQATGVENIDLLDSASAINATGTSANNLLIGNKFANTLSGGAGDDTLDGWFYSPYYSPVTDSTKATGNDTLIGGSGNDLYRIDSADDVIIESAVSVGVDTVEFKGAILTESYTLANGVENLKMLGNLKEGDGNNLNNRIIGDGTANILKGGYGDDYLDGGAGVDNFEGGYGDDTFLVDNLSEVIKETAGQGNDWVQSKTINLDLSAQGNWVDIENARLTGTSNLNVTGRETNNSLVGNDGSNVLDGRNGIDRLEGGLGNDTYVVDTKTDTLIEVDNVKDVAGKIKAGYIDTVQSNVAFDMQALFNFENLSLSGTGVITGTGNVNDNEIRGNDSANILKGLDGNDILDGAGGLDSLIGGYGNDTYRLSNDGDTITELANQGTDTIEIQNTFSLLQASLVNVENLTLLGTIAVNGTGNNGNNIVTGNSANNVLTGLIGDDKLIGASGADTLIGGKGMDTLDLTESAASKDVVRFAFGDSNANANEADKVIKFAALNDTLDLDGVIKIAANTSAVDGADAGTIRSHQIVSGIIKFDDVGGFTTPLTISAGNLSNAIDYLKANITDKSTVAFQAGADMWVYQDAGGADPLINDTLITLVGVSGVSSLSTGAFSSTALHIA